jgi:hypothetical protein
VAGSDAERRAANHLARRLRTLGRDARVEPTWIRPAAAIGFALHALVAITASLLAVAVPAAGLAVLLVAVVSAAGELTGRFQLLRLLTTRRASQNVASYARTERPGLLLLVAHLDAGRAGAPFRDKAERRRAAIGRRLGVAVGPFTGFAAVLGLLVVAVLARAAGADGIVTGDADALALAALQFLPTLALVGAVPLLLEAAVAPVSPGANDNASGVATALRLAERFGAGSLEHFDVGVVLTGAQEPLAVGMRAWLRAHRRELDPERTIVLNLDGLGRGTVRYAVREGALIGSATRPVLLESCRAAARAADDGPAVAEPIVLRGVSDAVVARAGRISALTVTARDELGLLPDHHASDDTPENLDQATLERAFGFCSALVERLDDEVGSHLGAAGRPVTGAFPAERRSSGRRRPWRGPGARGP